MFPSDLYRFLKIGGRFAATTLLRIRRIDGTRLDRLALLDLEDGTYVVVRHGPSGTVYLASEHGHAWQLTDLPDGTGVNPVSLYTAIALLYDAETELTDSEVRELLRDFTVRGRAIPTAEIPQVSVAPAESNGEPERRPDSSPERS